MYFKEPEDYRCDKVVLNVRKYNLNFIATEIYV